MLKYLQSERRRSRGPFRPEVGALDDRVLPSSGLAPLTVSVLAQRAAALASAARWVLSHSQPVPAYKPLVTALPRTVARPPAHRVVAPPRQVVARPPAHRAPAPPVFSPPVAPVHVAPTPAPPIPPAPSAPPAVNVGPVAGTESALEQQIVDLVNQQRQQNGLPLLQVNAKLVQAAQIHARDMAQLNSMQHTLPGAALPGLQDRLTYVGYNYSCAGENIAAYYPDAATVMQGWMNSPGHRANILNPSFTEIGVGVAYSSAGLPYFCQEFGQPA